ALVRRGEAGGPGRGVCAGRARLRVHRVRMRTLLEPRPSRACAHCSNHAHLVVRRHKDDDATIWHTFAGASAEALRKVGTIDPDHPVWASRPYGVFCTTCDGVRGRIKYVRENPEKEGLAPQSF